MLKKNKTITERVSLPKPNWDILSKIGAAIFLLFLVVGLPFLLITSSLDTTPEQISKVKVGMSKEEVFKILGEMGWSEYDEDGYDYGYKFYSPDGGLRVFWVTIKDGKVTDITTV